MRYSTYETEPGVTIRYAAAGEPSNACVVLIHGYPQTAYSFRHVLEPLAAKGFFVIAPDYRGAGGSTATEGGYDKWTMAGNIHALYRGLGKRSAIIVGTDIGSMVATALALRFRDSVDALCASECPQPGTSAFKLSVTDDEWKFSRVFHFFFHNAPDNMAEHLTVGKERFYLESFFKRLTANPNFLSTDDVDEYASAFEGWDRMRAGFELYRAFLQDCKDVRNAVAKGKLTCPVLATGGDQSPLAPLAEGMMLEVAENVEFKEIKGACHYIAEEAPTSFVDVLGPWLRKVAP